VLFFTTLKMKSFHNLGTKVTAAGLLVVIISAVFNEIWHRVLQFGNPLPEPFPVEPPHALLAIGIAISGVGAMLQPLEAREGLSPGTKLAVSLTAGSMWLIVAGSFFYVGAVYGNPISFFLAVIMGSFSAALFLRYSSLVTRRFGFATVAYLWFITVNYLFFVGPSGGIPLGLFIVVPFDYSGRKRRLDRPWLLDFISLVPIAFLYGIVYYPLLPIRLALAINPYAAASLLGVALELGIEKSWSRAALTGERLKVLTNVSAEADSGP